MANKESDANQIQVGDACFNQSDGFIQERDFLEVCQKLKDIHPWADDTLITDVMAGVNDFNRALALLEVMVSPDHTYVAHHDRKTKGFDIDKFLTPEEADTPCMQKFKEVDTDIKGVKSSNKDSLTNISIFAANKGVSLSQERGFLEVCQKLKDIHPWADDTLITDVMAGVDDFNMALALLEAMVSPDHTYIAHHNRKIKGFDIDKFLTPEEADTPCIQKFKEVDTDIKGVKSSNKDSLTNISIFAANKGVSSNEDSLTNISDFAANKGVSLTDIVNLDELSHALAMCLRSNSQELINNCVSRENKLHYDGAVGSMRFVPVEPELEEDDIYSIHRKDAVKMTRSAAQHSKAAREAYLRGDHLSAQHFSLKAREEWVAANRLNAQAAKEILTAHNGKNDQWTLDLHGLHAKEAVQAVQEHLQKIEAQVTQNLAAAHMNQVNFKPGFRGAVSAESSGCVDVENESKGSPLNKQRPAFLEVITGKGIHSRGQPALPVFIRSFLSENGYRYEETRPGVISVMPKFRPR